MKRERGTRHTGGCPSMPPTPGARFGDPSHGINHAHLAVDQACDEKTAGTQDTAPALSRLHGMPQRCPGSWLWWSCDAPGVWPRSGIKPSIATGVALSICVGSSGSRRYQILCRSERRECPGHDDRSAQNSGWQRDLSGSHRHSRSSDWKQPGFRPFSRRTGRCLPHLFSRAQPATALTRRSHTSLVA